ncbi:unnamed protein product [Adineta ricciae]|uniref:Transglutaminase-like domain-containing protein n=1 Tax=Adineta ricciae TaxID=249248 RepID=A0A814XW48_ADIRI|nr:unnamed protein product [Adineta ricciae]
MRNERLLTGYRPVNGVGRMEKREIDELEPYLEKRNGFTWLPQSNTDYYQSEIDHINLKIAENKHVLMQPEKNQTRSVIDSLNDIFSPSKIPMNNNPTTIITRHHDSASDTISRLRPTHIDLCKKKNMEEHATIYYDVEGLILRRGQAFSFILTFDQQFDIDKHHLSFIFKCHTWLNSLAIKIPLNGSSNDWSARRIDTENEDKKRIHFQIHSPCHALIGKYSLFLETCCMMEKDYLDKRTLTIFHLNSSEQVREYVMNEHGQIFLGLSDIPRSIPWYFGQFESIVLLTALELLRKIQVSVPYSIDTSVVLRMLASKICSEIGTTNGIFPSIFDARSASCPDNDYTSSPAILRLSRQPNTQSMQRDSGNNWQHAAVFCSLCRSLGIACRIVTIYNASCQVQERITSDTRPNVPHEQQSTVVVLSKTTRPWYLWNECWLRRDDLPRNFSGWQVLDSSFIRCGKPIRCVGPCSVAALKCHSLDLRWDTREIHSRLNGTRTYWLIHSNGTRELIKTEDDPINFRIITQSLKKEEEYEDLTDNYISIKTPNKTATTGDVDIEIKTPHSIENGNDLNLLLITNNRSDTNRTLTVKLMVVEVNCIDHSHVSNSQKSNRILTYTYQLSHQQEQSIRIKMTDIQGISKRCFDSLFKLFILANVNETNQKYQMEKYVLYEEPVSMKLFLYPNVTEVGRAVRLNVQITNSSSKPVINGRIVVDGLGAIKSFHTNMSIEPKQTVNIPVDFPTHRLGVGRLYVTFSTDYLRLPPVSVLLEALQTKSKQKKITTQTIQSVEKTKAPIDEPITSITSKPNDIQEVSRPSLNIDSQAEQTLQHIGKVSSKAIDNQTPFLGTSKTDIMQPGISITNDKKKTNNTVKVNATGNQTANLKTGADVIPNYQSGAPESNDTPAISTEKCTTPSTVVVEKPVTMVSLVNTEKSVAPKITTSTTTIDIEGSVATESSVTSEKPIIPSKTATTDTEKFIILGSIPTEASVHPEKPIALPITTKFDAEGTLLSESTSTGVRFDDEKPTTPSPTVFDAEESIAPEITASTTSCGVERSITTESSIDSKKLTTSPNTVTSDAEKVITPEDMQTVDLSGSGKSIALGSNETPPTDTDRSVVAGSIIIAETTDVDKPVTTENNPVDSLVDIEKSIAPLITTKNDTAKVITSEDTSREDLVDSEEPIAVKSSKIPAAGNDKFDTVDSTTLTATDDVEKPVTIESNSAGSSVDAEKSVAPPTATKFDVEETILSGTTSTKGTVDSEASAMPEQNTTSSPGEFDTEKSVVSEDAASSTVYDVEGSVTTGSLIDNEKYTTPSSTSTADAAKIITPEDISTKALADTEESIVLESGETPPTSVKKSAGVEGITIAATTTDVEKPVTTECSPAESLVNIEKSNAPEITTDLDVKELATENASKAVVVDTGNFTGSQITSTADVERSATAEAVEHEKHTKPQSAIVPATAANDIDKSTTSETTLSEKNTAPSPSLSDTKADAIPESITTTIPTDVEKSIPTESSSMAEAVHIEKSSEKQSTSSINVEEPVTTESNPIVEVVETDKLVPSERIVTHPPPADNEESVAPETTTTDIKEAVTTIDTAVAQAVDTDSHTVLSTTTTIDAEESSRIAANEKHAKAEDIVMPTTITIEAEEVDVKELITSSSIAETNSGIVIGDIEKLKASENSATPVTTSDEVEKADTRKDTPTVEVINTAPPTLKIEVQQSVVPESDIAKTESSVEQSVTIENSPKAVVLDTEKPVSAESVVAPPVPVDNEIFVTPENIAASETADIEQRDASSSMEVTSTVSELEKSETPSSTPTTTLSEIENVTNLIDVSNIPSSPTFTDASLTSKNVEMPSPVVYSNHQQLHRSLSDDEEVGTASALTPESELEELKIDNQIESSTLPDSAMVLQTNQFQITPTESALKSMKNIEQTEAEETINESAPARTLIGQGSQSFISSDTQVPADTVSEEKFIETHTISAQLGATTQDETSKDENKLHEDALLPDTQLDAAMANDHSKEESTPAVDEPLKTTSEEEANKQENVQLRSTSTILATQHTNERKDTDKEVQDKPGMSPSHVEHLENEAASDEHNETSVNINTMASEDALNLETGPALGVQLHPASFGEREKEVEVPIVQSFDEPLDSTNRDKGNEKDESQLERETLMKQPHDASVSEDRNKEEYGEPELQQSAEITAAVEITKKDELNLKTTESAEKPLHSTDGREEAVGNTSATSPTKSEDIIINEETKTADSAILEATNTPSDKPPDTPDQTASNSVFIFDQKQDNDAQLHNLIVNEDESKNDESEVVIITEDKVDIENATSSGRSAEFVTNKEAEMEGNMQLGTLSKVVQSYDAAISAETKADSGVNVETTSAFDKPLGTIVVHETNAQENVNSSSETPRKEEDYPEDDVHPQETPSLVDQSGETTTPHDECTSSFEKLDETIILNHKEKARDLTVNLNPLLELRSEDAVSDNEKKVDDMTPATSIDEVVNIEDVEKTQITEPQTDVRRDSKKQENIIVPETSTERTVHQDNENEGQLKIDFESSVKKSLVTIDDSKLNNNVSSDIATDTTIIQEDKLESTSPVGATLDTTVKGESTQNKYGNLGKIPSIGSFTSTATTHEEEKVDNASIKSAPSTEHLLDIGEEEPKIGDTEKRDVPVLYGTILDKMVIKDEKQENDAKAQTATSLDQSLDKIVSDERQKEHDGEFIGVQSPDVTADPIQDNDANAEHQKLNRNEVCDTTLSDIQLDTPTDGALENRDDIKAAMNNATQQNDETGEKIELESALSADRSHDDKVSTEERPQADSALDSTMINSGDKADVIKLETIVPSETVIQTILMHETIMDNIKKEDGVELDARSPSHIPTDTKMLQEETKYDNSTADVRSLLGNPLDTIVALEQSVGKPVGDAEKDEQEIRLETKSSLGALSNTAVKDEVKQGDVIDTSNNTELLEKQLERTVAPKAIPPVEDSLAISTNNEESTVNDTTLDTVTSVDKPLQTTVIVDKEPDSINEEVVVEIEKTLSIDTSTDRIPYEDEKKDKRVELDAEPSAKNRLNATGDHADNIVNSAPVDKIFTQETKEEVDVKNETTDSFVDKILDTPPSHKLKKEEHHDANKGRKDKDSTNPSLDATDAAQEKKVDSVTYDVEPSANTFLDSNVEPDEQRVKEEVKKENQVNLETMASLENPVDYATAQEQKTDNTEHSDALLVAKSIDTTVNEQSEEIVPELQNLSSSKKPVGTKVNDEEELHDAVNLTTESPAPKPLNTVALASQNNEVDLNQKTDLSRDKPSEENSSKDSDITVVDKQLVTSVEEKQTTEERSSDELSAIDTVQQDEKKEVQIKLGDNTPHDIAVVTKEKESDDDKLDVTIADGGNDEDQINPSTVESNNIGVEVILSHNQSFTTIDTPNQMKEQDTVPLLNKSPQETMTSEQQKTNNDVILDNTASNNDEKANQIQSNTPSSTDTSSDDRVVHENNYECQVQFNTLPMAENSPVVDKLSDITITGEETNANLEMSTPSSSDETQKTTVKEGDYVLEKIKPPELSSVIVKQVDNENAKNASVVENILDAVVIKKVKFDNALPVDHPLNTTDALEMKSVSSDIPLMGTDLMDESVPIGGRKLEIGDHLDEKSYGKPSDGSYNSIEVSSTDEGMTDNALKHWIDDVLRDVSVNLKAKDTPDNSMKREKVTKADEPVKTIVTENEDMQSTDNGLEDWLNELLRFIAQSIQSKLHENVNAPHSLDNREIDIEKLPSPTLITEQSSSVETSKEVEENEEQKEESNDEHLRNWIEALLYEVVQINLLQRQKKEDRSLPNEDQNHDTSKSTYLTTASAAIIPYEEENVYPTDADLRDWIHDILRELILTQQLRAFEVQGDIQSQTRDVESISTEFIHKENSTSPDQHSPVETIEHTGAEDDLEIIDNDLRDWIHDLLHQICLSSLANIHNEEVVSNSVQDRKDATHLVKPIVITSVSQNIVNSVNDASMEPISILEEDMKVWLEHLLDRILTTDGRNFDRKPSNVETYLSELESGWEMKKANDDTRDILHHIDDSPNDDTVMAAARHALPNFVIDLVGEMDNDCTVTTPSHEIVSDVKSPNLPENVTTMLSDIVKNQSDGFVSDRFEHHCENTVQDIIPSAVIDIIDELSANVDAGNNDTALNSNDTLVLSSSLLNEQHDETQQTDDDLKEWIHELLHQISTSHEPPHEINRENQVAMKELSPIAEANSKEEDLKGWIDHVLKQISLSKQPDVDDELNNPLQQISGSHEPKSEAIPEVHSTTAGRSSVGDVEPSDEDLKEWIDHILNTISHSKQADVHDKDHLSLLSTERMSDTKEIQPENDLDANDDDLRSWLHHLIRQLSLSLEPTTTTSEKVLIEDLEPSDEELKDWIDYELRHISLAKQSDTYDDDDDDLRSWLNHLLRQLSLSLEPRSGTTSEVNTPVPDKLLDENVEREDQDLRNWIDHLLNDISLSKQPEIDDEDDSEPTDDDLTSWLNCLLSQISLSEKPTSEITSARLLIEDVEREDQDLRNWIDYVLNEISLFKQPEIDGGEASEPTDDDLRSWLNRLLRQITISAEVDAAGSETADSELKAWISHVLNELSLSKLSNIDDDEDLRTWLNHLLRQIMLSESSKLLKRDERSTDQLVLETSDKDEVASIDDVPCKSLLSHINSHVSSEHTTNLDSNLEDVELDENVQLWLDNLVDRILTMATGKNFPVLPHDNSTIVKTVLAPTTTIEHNLKSKENSYTEDNVSQVSHESTCRRSSVTSVIEDIQRNVLDETADEKLIRIYTNYSESLLRNIFQSLNIPQTTITAPSSYELQTTKLFGQIIADRIYSRALSDIDSIFSNPSMVTSMSASDISSSSDDLTFHTAYDLMVESRDIRSDTASTSADFLSFTDDITSDIEDDEDEDDEFQIFSDGIILYADSLSHQLIESVLYSNKIQPKQSFNRDDNSQAERTPTLLDGSRSRNMFMPRDDNTRKNSKTRRLKRDDTLTATNPNESPEDIVTYF